MKKIHVLLIPDGNRRWAKKKNLPVSEGHWRGAKVTEKILKKARDLKIKYFTIWASSLDNLKKREKEEVKTLIKIYKEYFEKLLKEKEIEREKVKVNVVGNWREVLPEDLKNLIEKVIEKTKKFKNYFLTILLAYDGKKEMESCIKKIVKENPKNVDEKTILKNLPTGFLPPVDLIIRTGCEKDPHNSAGVMMWHTAYSQFAFLKTYYPDFSPSKFEKIIKDFLKRERRFGA